MTDFPSVAEQHEAFWNQSAGQCCLHLSVCSPSGDGYYNDSDYHKQRTDFNYRYGELQRVIADTAYFADGFCNYFVDLGPGMLAACVGGSYVFGRDTVWFDKQPIIQDWDEMPALALDPSSDLYRVAQAHTDAFLQHAAGRYAVSLPDIGGTYDVLAALRGTQNLLYDLYDEPEAVKKAAAAIRIAWKQMYDDFSARLLRGQKGLTSWMPIWSKKRYFPLQCDFSAMLSPEMFDEFIVEDLTDLSTHLDRAVYHLDGPGEIPHLPLLLNIPSIHAVQWTSGAGNANLSDPCWFEMYRQIQSAGKGLVLLGVDPNGFETLLRHVSPRGLFVSMEPADADQARELIQIAEGYSA